MGAWVLYQPRYKRPDGIVLSTSLTPKNGHEKKQYMKVMSRMLLICFIIGIFIALIFVIVIFAEAIHFGKPIKHLQLTKDS